MPHGDRNRNRNRNRNRDRTGDRDRDRDGTPDQMVRPPPPSSTTTAERTSDAGDRVGGGGSRRRVRDDDDGGRGSHGHVTDALLIPQSEKEWTSLCISTGPGKLLATLTAVIGALESNCLNFVPRVDLLFELYIAHRLRWVMFSDDDISVTNDKIRNDRYHEAELRDEGYINVSSIWLYLIAILLTREPYYTQIYETRRGFFPIIPHARPCDLTVHELRVVAHSLSIGPIPFQAYADRVFERDAWYMVLVCGAHLFGRFTESRLDDPTLRVMERAYTEAEQAALNGDIAAAGAVGASSGDFAVSSVLDESSRYYITPPDLFVMIDILLYHTHRAIVLSQHMYDLAGVVKVHFFAENVLPYTEAIRQWLRDQMSVTADERSLVTYSHLCSGMEIWPGGRSMYRTLMEGSLEDSADVPCTLYMPGVIDKILREGTSIGKECSFAGLDLSSARIALWLVVVFGERLAENSKVDWMDECVFYPVKLYQMAYITHQFPLIVYNDGTFFVVHQRDIYQVGVDATVALGLWMYLFDTVHLAALATLTQKQVNRHPYYDVRFLYEIIYSAHNPRAVSAGYMGASAIYHNEPVQTDARATAIMALQARYTGEQTVRQTAALIQKQIQKLELQKSLQTGALQPDQYLPPDAALYQQ